MWTLANMRHAKSQKQSGFTILELMIATMVFSVILLVVSAGILSFTKQYIKGITSSNTQAVARAVMSDIVQNIQFSGGIIRADTSLTPKQQCVGNVVYYYKIGQQVAPNQHALVKDTGACAPTGIGSFVSLGPSQHEMLGQGMRLAEFTVDSNADAGAKVTLTVVSGADDVLIDNSGKTASDVGFVWSDVHCKSGAGSQFCDVSRLTTFVQARVL
jgi:prepilin-type N-terminal cleavage/methylation domain-containing protein